MSNSSDTVQMTFNTYLSTLPKGQKAPSLEEMQQLLDTALLESGDGGPPPLLQITPMHPGLSFSMSVAPELMDPFGELSPETAMALLGHMQLLLQQQNFISMARRAETDATVQEGYLEEQQEGQMAMMDAQAQAMATGIHLDASDKAMLVATVVGAIIAILFAALLGGPLAIAVAGALVVLAGLETGSAISSAAGATRKDFDNKDVALKFGISDLTRMAFEQDVKDGRIVIAEQRPDGSWVDRTGKTIQDPKLTHPMAQVLTPKEYEERVTYTGLAVTLLFTFGTLAGGIGAALMPVKMLKVIQNVANLNRLLGTSMAVKQVQHVANATEIVSNAFQAGTTVGSGVTGVVYAVENYAVDKQQAALEHVKALIEFVTENREIILKALNELREQQHQAVLAMVRSIGDVYKGQVQIAQNITTVS